jgi:hypothetical protein
MSILLFQITIGILLLIISVGSVFSIKSYYNHHNQLLNIRKASLNRLEKKLVTGESNLISRTNSLLKAEEKVKIDIATIEKEKKIIDNFYSEESASRRLAKRKAFDYVSQMGCVNVSDVFMANLFESFLDEAEDEISAGAVSVVSTRWVPNYKKALWKNRD